MKRNSRHPSLRKRVIIIFLVMVLLPSAFLSYFGLKGFEKERQWQQQIVEKNLENMLSLAAKQVETSVTDHVQGIFNTIPSHDPYYRSEWIRRLESISGQYDIVDDLFILYNRDRILYPVPFQESAEFQTFENRQFASQNEYIQGGERLENRGFYGDAIIAFNQGRRFAASSELEMAFLVRIARCEMKLSRYQNALRTYTEILLAPHEQWNSLRIPYPLIAHLQIIRVKEKIDPELVPAAVLDFYELLVDHYYLFSLAQYEFYLEQAYQHIENIEDHLTEELAERFHRLRQYEETNLNSSKFRSWIESYIIPQLQRLPQGTFNDSNLRFETIQQNGSDLQLSIRNIEEETGNPVSYAFLLNEHAFRLFVTDIIDDLNLIQKIQIALINTEKTETVPVFPDISISLTDNLPLIASLYPGYHLGFKPFDDTVIDSMYSRNVFLYTILIITIISIIGIGLIFLLRDIYREEEVARMKSEFISNVSHEIKTPIATIRTLTENLKEGWIKKPGHQKEYYILISRESERLSHIVENILKFSRNEAMLNNLRMKVTPASDVIRESLERFSMMILDKPVHFKASVPGKLPDVYCDPKAIEQVILNLLDNAVKYSGQDKHIEFSAKANNGNIVLSVQDNGNGIAKRNLSKIFERFYRIESVNGHKIPGSGIGLSLVKDIVDKHQGKIDVRSIPAEGSTFTIYLPVTSETDYEMHTSHRR